MDYQRLRHQFNVDPSLRLMRAQNAPLILAFLHRCFKSDVALTKHLGEVWEALAQFLETEVRPSETGGEGETPARDKARRYLEEWTNAQWLERLYDPERGEESVRLTQYAERALLWAASLEKRPFVGAESRYRDMTQKMEEVLTETTEDAETQAQTLEAQREALDERIERIRRKGKPETMDDYQVHSRVDELVRLGREMLADFQEVEENFRQIRKQVYRRQSQAGMTRGRLLGQTLDALDALKQADQGKSFYTFWQYLTSERRRRRLDEMTQRLCSLVRERELPIDVDFLRNLRHYLHEAAQQVVTSNYQLAERLNRILTGSRLEHRRHLLDTIAEIRRMALSLENPPSAQEAFFWLETGPKVHLPLERKLADPPQKPRLADQPKPFRERQHDQPAFPSLFNRYAVDKQRLRDQIELFLSENPSVRLDEVLAHHPLELGLGEVLAYLSVASEAPQHEIDDNERLLVEMPRQEKRVEMPSVLYRRENAAPSQGNAPTDG
jgi:hypothetical protein